MSSTGLLARKSAAAARLLLAGVVAALLAACLPAPIAHAESHYPSGASRPLPQALHAHSTRRSPRTGTAAGAARASRAARAARAKPKAPARRRKPALHGNPLRAQRAFAAMQRFYYIAGSGLYSGEPFSYLWPFSQALAATVSMSNIPALKGVPALKGAYRKELRARLVGLRAYLDTNNSGAPEGTFTSTLAAYDGTVAPPVGPGGTKYYDDNDWVGIELMRIYKLTRSPAMLGAAEGIMAFEMAGWQADPRLACPGGIPFSNDLQNTDRNTVTNAPAAELALQLYLATKKAEYLRFAEMAYAWVRRCLLEPSGLYSDHIRRGGAIDPTVWSYNQGTMIGAGALLYRATGNAGYLYEARQTARAALAYFVPQRLGAENPFFPSVYFRNLLYLDSITHDPPGPRIAQAYADYAWQNLRLGSDLFVAGSPATAQLLVQAAIVQIYALLSSPASSYF
jgi:hypothetical protein